MRLFAWLAPGAGPPDPRGYFSQQEAGRGALWGAFWGAGRGCRKGGFSRRDFKAGFQGGAGVVAGAGNYRCGQGLAAERIKARHMAIERTLSIIKPDATRRNLTGKINAKFEEAGLRIVAQKRIFLSLAQAQKFYEAHKDRPFFGELTEFMASEPVVVQVLEGEGAIAKNREVMGATNPANADDGTIRKEFALSVGENSVHGSDAPETAAEEIAYFFSGLELVG